MWYGLAEFLTLALGVALVVNLISRRYVANVPLGALLTAAIDSALNSLVAEGNMTPNLVVGIFYICAASALPMCAVVSLIFFVIRQFRKQPAPAVEANGVQA